MMLLRKQVQYAELRTYHGVRHMFPDAAHDRNWRRRPAVRRASGAACGLRGRGLLWPRASASRCVPKVPRLKDKAHFGSFMNCELAGCIPFFVGTGLSTLSGVARVLRSGGCHRGLRGSAWIGPGAVSEDPRTTGAAPPGRGQKRATWQRRYGTRSSAIRNWRRFCRV